MSTFLEVDKAWHDTIDRVNTIFKNKRKRFFTFSKAGHETRIIVFVDRKTQEILLKISIDFQFKTVLEKDTKMVDIHSQDANIAELVKQTESFIKLDECLLAYREAERSNTVYSRLSS